MKLIKSLKWILVTMIVLLFASCSNESIDTNFSENQQRSQSGKFIATINNTTSFDAGASSAVLYTNGVLVITGANYGTSLSVGNAAVGAFNLDASVGTNSNNPYTTSLDGSNSMMITELDMNAQVVSGTFSFTANRITLDADGNPITETINFSKGEYFKIPFTIENTILEDQDNNSINTNSSIIIEDTETI